MEQVQVHVVQPELAQARVEGAEATLVAVVADPQLGLDEQLCAGDPAIPDAFPHLPLG